LAGLSVNTETFHPLHNMSFTLCTSGAAIAKAGANANADVILNSTILNAWSDETEASINSETRRDWLASSAATNFKGALADIASADIANKIINYDPSAYPSKVETMLNVNNDKFRKGIAFLKEIDVQEKM